MITGIAGFAGSHLAEHLLEAGWEVSGIEPRGVSLDNLAGVIDRVRLEECDILDAGRLERALGKIKPEIIFHLAAIAFVPSADEAPDAALDVNVKGSLNLLQGCRKQLPSAGIVLAGSAEVYGVVGPGELPLREKQDGVPANFYALTKLCTEQFALWFHRNYGTRVMILRPFNHIGPRQSPRFAISSFASQIADIEAGRRQPVLRVGNLDAKRDFMDVRDMARAYRLAAERLTPGGIYNVCSGRAISIREMLDKLLSLSAKEIEVRKDPERLRKSEVPVLVGDCSRFRNATGWKCDYPLDRTLGDILDYWRRKNVARNAGDD